MIAIFDEDGGGDVDFQEFVLGLSAFSARGNKEEKYKFAFKVYDIDRDGYISNGELFIVLKMMVGSNLKDQQLQQIVDKTIMEADKDGDGKISFEEFQAMVENTDVSMSMTLGRLNASSATECPTNPRQINSKRSLFIRSERRVPQTPEQKGMRRPHRDAYSLLIAGTRPAMHEVTKNEQLLDSGPTFTKAVRSI